MKLRINVSPRSGERDQSFTTTYGDVRYTIGPDIVEVNEEASQYLVRSFSDIIEVVIEPAPVVLAVSDEEIKPAPIAKKPAKKKKAVKSKKS
mgnify:CR=1 FL=1